METRTSEEITTHLNSIDTTDLRYDEYTKKHESARWVPTKDITEWCNAWFDTRRKNNEMWRHNQDDLSGMFLEDLEKELKRAG